MSAERWHVVMSVKNDAPDNLPFRIDRFELTITINQPGILPDTIADQMLRAMRVSSFTHVVRTEPIDEQGLRIAKLLTAEQLRTGVVSGLTKEEVASFLAAIGYPDAMDSPEESSGMG